MNYPSSSPISVSSSFTGVVTTWFRARRYGFILPDGLQGEESCVFAHANDFVAGSLPPYRGARVQFHTAVFQGRIKAIKASLIDVEAVEVRP